jgi:hypothetical protein
MEGDGTTQAHSVLYTYSPTVRSTKTILKGLGTCNIFLPIFYMHTKKMNCFRWILFRCHLLSLSPSRSSLCVADRGSAQAGAQALTSSVSLFVLVLCLYLI